VQSGTFLKYGQSADSSIDVGIKPEGAGWSVSGNVHIGNSNSTAVQWNVGSQFGYKLRSGFLYKEYYVTWGPGCEAPYYKTAADHWSLSPHGAEAPQSNDYNHDLDNNCKTSSWPSDNGPNTSVLRDSSAFVHFDIGFSAFGFDAGAQSGSSQYVVEHWKFGSAKDHYLCGSDNDIARAHRIFAGFG
jgi:hypothetical protein